MTSTIHPAANNTSSGGDGSALALYDRLASYAGTDTYVAWGDLAKRLRDAAEHLTGGYRQQHIDRAELCDARARLQARSQARERAEAQPNFSDFADEWLSIGATEVRRANSSVEADGHAARTGGAL